MKALLGAMNSVMADVANAKKDGKNEFHKYLYTTEAGLLAALRPAMVKHGLILIPSVATDPAPYVDENQTTHIMVEYTLAHTSGETWPHPIRIPGAGQDKGDKGTYKALTGANKYALFKLFQIASGDDPENETSPAPEKKAVRKKRDTAEKVAHQPPPVEYEGGMNPGAGMDRLRAAFDKEGEPVKAMSTLSDGAWVNSFNAIGALMFGQANWFYHHVVTRHPDWEAPGGGINYGMLPPKYMESLLGKLARQSEKWKRIHGNWEAEFPAILKEAGRDRWLQVSDAEFESILDSGLAGVGKEVEVPVE